VEREERVEDRKTGEWEGWGMERRVGRFEWGTKYQLYTHNTSENQPIYSSCRALTHIIIKPSIYTESNGKNCIFISISLETDEIY
jgi:hypothetical protein